MLEPKTDTFVRLATTLYREGIVGLPGTFSREWGEILYEDFLLLFDEARSYPGGVMERGSNRFYFAIHPERLRGFRELVENPLITGLAAHILGNDWEIVEFGFDVPLPGSTYQPWHRDYPIPAETRDGGRLTSVVFNITGVDVSEEMGPFEIAPGTHWDAGTDFSDGMFPPRDTWERYEQLKVQKMPKLGDVSARTGLAIHRGTPNRSDKLRPVMVLGINGPEADGSNVEPVVISRRFWTGLPEEVQRHIRCKVVDELTPLIQGHCIDGLR